MAHRCSAADGAFARAFRAFEVSPDDFDHRAHVRLAYVLICEHGAAGAHSAMRDALQGFLAHLGAPADKYHETITAAWIKAVRHFMEKTPACGSADAFIAANPVLLDSKIMLGHYSAELLFSDAARAAWVEPDVDPIPEYPERDQGANSTA